MIARPTGLAERGGARPTYGALRQRQCLAGLRSSIGCDSACKRASVRKRAVRKGVKRCSEGPGLGAACASWDIAAGGLRERCTA